MPVDHSHEISLDMAVADAFPLFTPKGEEAWVPGWRPTYLEPVDGATTVEMLFTTGVEEETTFWTCLTYEPEHHHARYLRITPASRIAFVDVHCRAKGPARSHVTVAYRFFALNAAGEAHLAALTPDAYARMIEEWGTLIHSARKGIIEQPPHVGSRVLQHD